MPSYLQQLSNKGLLHAATDHLYDSIRYEIIMVSLACGVINDNNALNLICD